MNKFTNRVGLILSVFDAACVVLFLVSVYQQQPVALLAMILATTLGLGTLVILLRRREKQK